MDDHHLPPPDGHIYQSDHEISPMNDWQCAYYGTRHDANEQAYWNDEKDVSDQLREIVGLIEVLILVEMSKTFNIGIIA